MRQIEIDVTLRQVCSLNLRRSTVKVFFYKLHRNTMMHHYNYIKSNGKFGLCGKFGNDSILSTSPY